MALEKIHFAKEKATEKKVMDILIGKAEGKTAIDAAAGLCI